jgi:hypothetical protein
MAKKANTNAKILIRISGIIPDKYEKITENKISKKGFKK